MSDFDPTTPKGLGLCASWGLFFVSKWLAAIGIHAWSDFAGMTAGLLSTLMVIKLIRDEWRKRK